MALTVCGGHWQYKVDIGHFRSTDQQVGVVPEPSSRFECNSTRGENRKYGAHGGTWAIDSSPQLRKVRGSLDGCRLRQERQTRQQMSESVQGSGKPTASRGLTFGGRCTAVAAGSSFFSSFSLLRTITTTACLPPNRASHIHPINVHATNRDEPPAKSIRPGQGCRDASRSRQTGIKTLS